MSEDLSGTDAFEKVLEAALSAHCDAKTANELRYRAAVADLDRANTKLQTLKGEISRSEPILAGLHEAASKVLTMVRNGIDKDAEIKAALQALEKNLSESAMYCGVVPF